MANAIITITIMPVDPTVDLGKIEVEAKKKIAHFAGEGETRTVIEPIAFGLKAVKITFVIDEKKGSPDPIEEAIRTIEGVNSAEVSDVRRAIG